MLRHIALLVLFLLLSGCNQADLLQKFTSPEEQAVAKGYIDLLRQHRFDEIESALDPSIARPDMRNVLSEMASMVPTSEPTSVTLVGANSVHTPDYSTANLTYEYEFSGKWLLANVAVKKEGEVTTIVGLNVYPQVASLEEQNRFSLSGKSPGQYAALVLAILLPLLTLFSLVVCIRTELKGRKWPWVLFIIAGIGKFSVNWATGQWTIAPVAFQLFSVSAFAPPFGPWTLAVSVPVGAVIFLILRKRLQAETVGS